MKKVSRRAILQFGCLGVAALQFPSAILGRQAFESATANTSNAKWLKRYQGKPSYLVTKRKRFREMMMAQFAATPVKWYGARNVWQAMMNFMDGPSGEVTVAHNRYITIDGYRPHNATSKGMVWIDTVQAEHLNAPRIVFVAIVHRRMLSQIRMFTNDPQFLREQSGLHPQFKQSLKQWVTREGLRYHGKIIKSTLVSPGGQHREISTRNLGVPANKIGGKPARNEIRPV